MLTEKDYCDKDTCVALKEMGYKGMSRYYYIQQDHKLHYDTYNKFYTVRTADAMGYVLAIHLYEAQKFLREEKNIMIEIPTSFMDDGVWKFNFRIQTPEFYDRAIGEWDSYEEALLEGIKEAVKILKEK